MAVDDSAYEALMQFLYRTPIGLVQTTLDGTIEMLNPMSSQLLMPLAQDGMLENLFTVLERVAPQLRAMVATFAHPSGVVCEGLRLDVDGSGGAQVLSLNILKVDEARLMAAVSDITLETQREQERLANRLSSAARTDALTRMPNRSAVLEQLRLIQGREQGGDDGNGFAVLFMNCDRFRQVNDALGQRAGDQLLVMIADRIRNVLRPPTDRIGAHGGQLAARVGGDEFIVVLDGLRRPEDAESVAARLINAVGRGYTVQGHDVVCSVSVGIAWGGAPPQEPDELLRDASIAMVEAKRAGGSRHVRFAQAMRERAARRSDIEADLRLALQEEQLFVVYQPVVALRADGSTDYAAGVEALVRWQHPVRGVVPPFEFIGIAEECGLIGALGDFVLQRACTDFQAWRRALGEAAPRLLAVNLSRAQLGQAGWSETVARILAETGVDARQLQLEVTESLAAQDAQIQQRLHELKALGITLALDDFGTGYSSLASLHLLPVDTVKIDRSFVSQSESSEHHRVLIEAAVKVAQSLGMSTVAEGIETTAQAEVVRALRCDKGQGYLYSKPLTSDALLTWLATHRTSG
ncbi:putative bifunctional diguanylate cyclase/phosphodiesterase [Pseudoduganella chitinolytica]|uniref:Bifunctional diguanylate cyclase/phosphodiesterase n=1 Tax=Pseudoduganella chitinolytica TaxID=34070 RepID=A0ABY8B4H4_9BURK|nr:bifunctional diguanylate cyclase/phosphodiesterase [Pseudoduganella chitinolytica]WEF30685.1 bifunctional diguanylate cyclase/phosphodiesterase [Pseudoduganella chitinolytica]